MRTKLLTTTIALALGLTLPGAAFAQQSPQEQQPSAQQQPGGQQANQTQQTQAMQQIQQARSDLQNAQQRLQQASQAEDRETTGQRMEQQTEQRAERTAPAEGQVAAMGTELVGKDLYGADDRRIGQVEDVVMGPDGQVESVLTDVGGFLGIGSKRVSLSVDQLQMEGDRLIATNVTRE